MCSAQLDGGYHHARVALAGLVAGLPQQRIEPCLGQWWQRGSELMMQWRRVTWQQEEETMIQRWEISSAGKGSGGPANMFAMFTEPALNMRWFCRKVKTFNFFRKGRLIWETQSRRVLWWVHICWFAEPCGPLWSLFPSVPVAVGGQPCVPQKRNIFQYQCPKRGEWQRGEHCGPRFKCWNILAGKTCCHWFGDVSFPSSYLPHLFDWGLVLVWILKTKRKETKFSL